MDVSNDSIYRVVMNYDVHKYLLYIMDKDVSDALLALCPGLLTSVLRCLLFSSLSAVLHLNVTGRQLNIYMTIYTYLTSWHTEITRYYPEFPECQEIKHMRKQALF